MRLCIGMSQTWPPVTIPNRNKGVRILDFWGGEGFGTPSLASEMGEKKFEKQ